MSIPGKVLVALISALTVSLLSSMVMPSVQFLQLLLPTAVAACAAVILSHRAIPMPTGLTAGETAEARPVAAGKGKKPGVDGKKKPGRKKGVGSPAKGGQATETGTVKWFNSTKGFGFIVRASGEEIFVHHRNIKGEGRRSLRDGASVQFSVVDTEKGPQAEDVEVVD